MLRAAWLVAIALAPPMSAAAAELPYIHAHRGGSQQLTRPAFAEETMPALRDAWEVRRTVLELDVKLSSDRVPVVIHDDTLDRTTPCTGAVAAKTAPLNVEIKNISGEGDFDAGSAYATTVIDEIKASACPWSSSSSRASGRPTSTWPSSSSRACRRRS